MGALSAATNPYVNAFTPERSDQSHLSKSSLTSKIAEPGILGACHGRVGIEIGFHPLSLIGHVYVKISVIRFSFADMRTQVSDATCSLQDWYTQLHPHLRIDARYTCGCHSYGLDSNI